MSRKLFVIRYQEEVAGGGNGGGETLTQTVKVSQSDHDAHEATDGSVTTDGIVLGSDVPDEWDIMIFDLDEIPAGATVNSASITGIVNSSSQDEPLVHIYAERSSNPAAATTSTNDISGRSKTTASVTWDEPDLGLTSGDPITTPDISTILQEVIDNHAPLSRIAVMWEGDTSTRDLQIRSWDYDDPPGEFGNFAPELTIEYTT